MRLWTLLSLSAVSADCMPLCIKLIKRGLLSKADYVAIAIARMNAVASVVQ